MNEKITQEHLERGAWIYVRQSTNHQVRQNHPGRQRQYDLKVRALELGFSDVKIVDDDQGKTGSGLVERPGFAALLAKVCRGELGAVFALEASRLARNNRDWHHLIDLCSLTGTLLIDGEGIYPKRSVAREVAKSSGDCQPNHAFVRSSRILAMPGRWRMARTEAKVTVQQGRARKSATRQRKPQEKWKVLLRENHESYITWQEFQENLSMLEANSRRREPSAQSVVKKGEALLGGLLR